MPYVSVISGSFFKTIAVFELGGLDTIFKLECLTAWLQGRSGGKIFRVFGVLAEIERSLPAGLCGKMGTSCLCTKSWQAGSNVHRLELDFPSFCLCPSIISLLLKANQIDLYIYIQIYTYIHTLYT